MTGKKVEAPANGAVTYKLKHPFERGSEKITELVFQRPKGKHLKHIGTAPTLEQIMKIAAQVSGQPPSVIDELDAEDYLACTEVINGFLGGGQEIG